MSFNLRFGNLVLEGAREIAGSDPSRVTRHYFPRKPGSIAPRVPAPDSKTINLQGEIWKDSEAQVIAYFEQLGTKFLNGRDRLYLRDNDRYLNAVKEGFNWRFVAERNPLVCAIYSLQFFADDPFFYAPQHSEQTETVGAVNTYTFSVTNNGGARTPAVIEVARTDPANDQADVIVTHTTTGLFMKWAGSLPDGNILTFDCVNTRVTASGAPGLPNFTGTLFWALEPGLNNFQYDGPGNVSIVIAWQERWGQS